MKRPGSRLRPMFARVCSPSTMARQIDPVIADLQWEHDVAAKTGGRWRRWRTLATGYIAFWKMVAISLPFWTARSVRDMAERDGWALARVLGCATLVVSVMSLALVLPPYQHISLRSIGPAWRLLLLLPQAMPLSLPIGLLAGTLWGLRNRTASRHRHAILGVGLASSLAMAGTIGWLMPAANQAFRVAVAGHEISRGQAETPILSLRQQALELKAHGALGRAESLLLAYHARWAIAGAALGFALFGLGVSGLRPGRAAGAFAGLAAPAVYMTYLFLLDNGHRSVPDNEAAVIVLAWLPNLLLLGVSVLFLLNTREEPAER